MKRNDKFEIFGVDLKTRFKKSVSKLHLHSVKISGSPAAAHFLQN